MEAFALWEHSFDAAAAEALSVVLSHPYKTCILAEARVKTDCFFGVRGRGGGPMKVIVFGASGMVGQGTLRACLRDPGVTEVTVVVRSPLGRADPKLREVVRANVGELGGAEGELRGFDATFWCLGVTSAGKSEAEYRKVTYDLTLSAATSLAEWNPGMTFVYVSGTGTDSTERGRTMWARVKGATENALLRLPFRSAYMFRPGVIRAERGIRSRTTSYRLMYAIFGPIVRLVGWVAPNSITSTDRVGRAMITVVRMQPAERIVGTRAINALAG